MEANNSSPHSSNSITQPPFSPMSPTNAQTYDNINSHLASSVHFEGYFKNPQSLTHQDNVENNELLTSWNNLISPDSFSSYFNYEDAEVRWDPSGESLPFLINDQLD